MKQIIFFIIIFSSAWVKAEEPILDKKAHKEVFKYFSNENLHFSEINELSNKSELFFNIIDNKQEIGTLVLSSAMGRFDKFDYMVIYNKDLEIEFIKILVYRSDYGSEITAKKWLSQFYKKKNANFKYGDDIQAISGATLSANSLTENIHRITILILDFSNKQ
ncbi:MAG TPA: FMN-binding protein [Bacteroidales bacterium]|nr:FMN-binding protein [Bacteroidales bacterium]